VPTRAAAPAKRPYNSQRRLQQAGVTRRAMIDAAQALFVRHGYVATTMDMIAVEAGVALKTVYTAFTTKGGLLRAVWDLCLKGDIDDAPVAARPWYLDVLAERDPERMLRLMAHHVRIVKTRIGPILRVIRSAAVVDADGAALWQLINSDFHENQRVIVNALHAKGGLRTDLSLDEATDILWTVNHPDVWLLLVGERGWTADRFESWFADTVCQQLLVPRRPSRARVRQNV